MSISYSLAKGHTFTTSVAFHCRAHNDINFIVKVAEYDEKHQTLLIFYSNATRMDG
jgi:hypothetical protein